MFAFADAVARACRFVIGSEEPTLRTISADGCIVGWLVRDADGRRLARFAGADPGFGAAVELQALPS